jgi:hypothetical protein
VSAIAERAQGGRLSGVKCGERRLVDGDGRRRVDDHNPLRGAKLGNAIRVGTLFHQLLVDLARDEHLHVKCSRDVEAPDPGEVQQWCRVGDDDHVSDASSDLKSSGS